jgi:hypothetical protein
VVPGGSWVVVPEKRLRNIDSLAVRISLGEDGCPSNAIRMHRSIPWKHVFMWVICGLAGFGRANLVTSAHRRHADPAMST